ncbi:MAG: hypothetical protein ACI4I6_09490 [Hominimerdicola sp.]
MIVNRVEKIFDGESGEKEFVLVNTPDSNNACVSIGLSIEGGSVEVMGKVSKDSAEMSLGMINLETAGITNIATEGGVFSVLGAETLYSVKFIASLNTTATVKFIY